MTWRDDVEAERFTERNPEWSIVTSARLKTIRQALMTPGVEIMAYPGGINGQMVTVVGIRTQQQDGLSTGEPLFVLYDDTLHDLVDVPDSTKIGGRDGQER